MMAVQAIENGTGKIMKRLSILILSCVTLLGLAVQSGATGDEQPGPITDRDAAIRAISEHFVSVPTMSGEFIQFGPNGEQTGGIFFIQRPGKIRFNYEEPSPIMVVSNGKTLGVRNKKLKTWNYYPLDKTPLSLLLSNELQIGDKAIRSVEAGEDITTVVMGDESLFGDSEITLLFDPRTQDLRQWTIKDAQGKETSVMIFNVQKNIDLPNRLFIVDTTENGRTKTFR